MFLLSSSAFPQGFYPLHKGNLWQYSSNDPQAPPSRWETLILGDTALPNGKTYAQFNQTNFGTRFLRQDGSNVFGYSQSDTTEFLLFDFAANPGDTLTKFPTQQWRIVLRVIYPSGYLGHTTWVFVLLAGSGPGTYDFTDWWITDSLGLTYIFGEPGIGSVVTGMRINGVIYGTIIAVQSPRIAVPIVSRLYQNYPNPFNPTTIITFDLARGAEVRITVFSLLGQELLTLRHDLYSAGSHSFTWDASGFPSGCYFLRMTTPHFSDTRRVLLLK
jgi:hypothetical protein